VSGESLTLSDGRFKFLPEFHPVLQARYLTPRKPYPWQCAIFDALWRDGAQVACICCNEAGKTSYVVPIFAISVCLAFPGSRVVITSASERQLDEQLAPSLRSFCLRQPEWNFRNDKVVFPSIDGLRSSEILYFCTKEGGRFEGFHKDIQPDRDFNDRPFPLVIINDEAKSGRTEIFEAIERCNANVVLYISTSGENNGEFYDACMNKSKTWTTEWTWQGKKIQFAPEGIDWTQCPHLLKEPSRSRKKAMIETHGQDHPKVCSILLAKFFRSDAYHVFNDNDLAKVGHAMSGMREKIGSTKMAFCDFAGGGDESTFGCRDGNFIYPLVCWKRSSGSAPSDEALKYIRLYEQFGLRDDQVYGDNGGLGAEIIREIEKNGWYINKVNSNQLPMDKLQFVDEYAELHWKLKRLMNENAVILPKDEILLEQMRKRQFLMRNQDDNRIRIESKEIARKTRKENSPDRLDTVIQLCRSVEDLQAFTIEDKKKMSKCGDPKEALMMCGQEDEQIGVMNHGWRGV